MTAQADFDVIIVGGGIAGTALALALAKTSLRIALLEAGSPLNEMINQSDAVAGFDARVSALTENSRQFFEQLDVWSLMCYQRVSAYKKMRVWDAEGTAEMAFDCREVAAPWLGHIVENRVIVQSLLKRLKNYPAVTLRHNVRVKNLQLADDVQTLVLDNESTLSAALIVAADGANSFLRDAAGFAVRQWDYGHKAIVCTVQTELSHQQTAWQRFLPQGPLAFLPLVSANVEAEKNQRFCSIVWSAVPELTDELMALDEETFCLRLERAFESRLGKVISIGARQCFPLQQRHAVDYCKPGIALIADAAHTVHPLAGQGINLGLKDVQVLAEEIIYAAGRGMNIGSLDVLSRYQRRRKANNLSTMAAMEGFKQLFARNELSLRWLRNAGMRFFNRQPLIKRVLIRQAMDV
jgi:2-octaprenylphenol hydroxylase